MSTARILVVEDEYITAMHIEKRLSDFGYTVVGKTGLGEEAVQLAREQRPDLVLMDIRLQGAMDGVTAAAEIRRQHDVPVIYLSAHADEGTLARARATEPSGYLLKPFRDREMQTTIEMALYKHQAERKLRASERRYGVTLSSIGDAVIATDGEGRVTLMNPSAERLTGWLRAEAVGRPLDDVFTIINEQDRARMENPATRVLKEGVVVDLANHTLLISRDGRETPIADCAAPIVDGGECLGAVLVFRDVADKKRLEAELRQAQRMEALGRLAGGVAHDFNNLLTAILGYSSLLLGGMDQTHPWHEFIQVINDAGERAANLTRQLLVFSRKQILQAKALDLNQIVTGMEKLLHRVIGENIEMVMTPDPTVGTVWADPGQIEQVILNLAINARDAMPRGGRLTLATAHVILDESQVRDLPGMSPGSYEQLTVSDSGCGMSAAVRGRIFEPFFTTKEPGKGTGMGLATVYGIVKQSEGHIFVASESGRGTTFTIYLPTRNAPPPHAESRVDLPDLPRGTETVLLVEDDEVVRAFTRKILQVCGYTILEARHGVEGLEVSERYSGPVHALVTDVVMPHLGGLELAERLLSQRLGLKVLYMTGYTEFPEQLLESPGRAVLKKPFAPADFARKLRELLDGT